MDKSGLFLRQTNGQEAFVCVGSVCVWARASVSLHETWTDHIIFFLAYRAKNQDNKELIKLVFRCSKGVSFSSNPSFGRTPTFHPKYLCSDLLLLFRFCRKKKMTFFVSLLCI